MTLPATTVPATGSPTALLDCEPRRLASDLFHALSQPLTALCCSLELALRQTLTADQYRESVSRALMQAERVSYLATGMRELFEAERASEECEVLDLQTATAGAISDICLVAEAAGVQICYLPETACPVWFDAQRLRQGLFHLLGFVVGCGRSASVVRIELSQCGQDVVLALTVSGTGGSRLHASSSNPEHGDLPEEFARRLGLGIARAIFEAAEGSFRAECSLECVSVEVRLPGVGEQ